MEDEAEPCSGSRAAKEEVITHFTIKVQTNDASHSVCLRIKRNAPLKTLMQAYCDYTGTNYNVIKFCFDGRQVKENDTADKLEMEDGCIIDVFNDMIGGSKLFGLRH